LPGNKRQDTRDEQSPTFLIGTKNRKKLKGKKTPPPGEVERLDLVKAKTRKMKAPDSAEDFKENCVEHFRLGGVLLKTTERGERKKR